MAPIAWRVVTAGAVATEDVGRGDRRAGARLVFELDFDVSVMLRDAEDNDASDQGGKRRRRHRVAEELLDEGLGHLLAALGDQVGPRQLEAEAVRDPGDLPTEHRRAEDDLLRPGDRQRRALAQLVSESPAPQVLHRPRRHGLRARSQQADLPATLEDEGADPVMGQLEGGRQPDGPPPTMTTGGAVASATVGVVAGI
jgi:hypothetical protein